MNRWQNNLPKHWNVVKFSDIAELRHGYQFRTFDFTEEGVKVFKITQIKGRGIADISDCSYIAKERLKQFEKFRINKGDILIALTGATIGKIAKFNENEVVLQNYRVGNFFPLDEKKLSKEYLYQFLRSDFFYNQILAMQTQSAQQNIGKEDINNMSLIVPPIAEQKIIAEILSSLDDKIELNNKINKNLEDLAQTLFKRWFIDFDFSDKNGKPYKSSGGKMVESELGEIPGGWEVSNIGTIANVIDCLHSKKPREVLDKTEHFILQLNNILDSGLISLAKKYFVSRDDYTKWISRIEVNEGDIVITNVGRSGAVGRIPRGVKAAIGRNMTACRLKSNFSYPGYIATLMKSKWMSKEIESKLDSGTILDSLNVRSIPKLRFVKPSFQTLSLYEEELLNLWRQRELNEMINVNLSQLRDTLIHKLLSGKLEVKNNKQQATS